MAIGRGAEIPDGAILHDGVVGLAGRDGAGITQVGYAPGDACQAGCSRPSLNNGKRHLSAH